MKDQTWKSDMMVTDPFHDPLCQGTMQVVEVHDESIHVHLSETLSARCQSEGWSMSTHSSGLKFETSPLAASERHPFDTEAHTQAECPVTPFSLQRHDP